MSENDEYKKCTECGGSGWIKPLDANGKGGMPITRGRLTCVHCKGSGREPEKPDAEKKAT
jgi:DnaJ-class molecular chaperone